VEWARDIGISSATQHIHTHFQWAFDVVALCWGPIPLKTWSHGPVCPIMPMHSSSTYATYATYAISSLSSSGPLPVSSISRWNMPPTSHQFRQPVHLMVAYHSCTLSSLLYAPSDLVWALVHQCLASVLGPERGGPKGQCTNFVGGIFFVQALFH
jgi:hypothetical protein